MSAWSVKTPSTLSRQCRDGCEGTTTAAMHENEYTPPRLPRTSVLSPSLRQVRLLFSDDLPLFPGKSPNLLARSHSDVPYTHAPVFPLARLSRLSVSTSRLSPSAFDTPCGEECHSFAVRWRYLRRPPPFFSLLQHAIHGGVAPRSPLRP